MHHHIERGCDRFYVPVPHVHDEFPDGTGHLLPIVPLAIEVSPPLCGGCVVHGHASGALLALQVFQHLEAFHDRQRCYLVDNFAGFQFQLHGASSGVKRRWPVDNFASFQFQLCGALSGVRRLWPVNNFAGFQFQPRGALSRVQRRWPVDNFAGFQFQLRGALTGEQHLWPGRHLGFRLTQHHVYGALPDVLLSLCTIVFRHVNIHR